MTTEADHRVSLKCISHWWAHINSVEPEDTWQILRHTVQHQLLNNRAIALPFLSEFQMHTLQTAVLKMPMPAAAKVILGHKPGYRACGKLDRLLIEMTKGCREHIKGIRRSEDKTITPHWRNVYTDRRTGVKKEMEMIVAKCVTEKSSTFTPNDIRFDMDILTEMIGGPEPPKAVYIVHERYVASVYIRVEIGSLNKRHMFENCCIGFVLTKYNLDQNGKLTYEKEVRGDNFEGKFVRMSEVKWPSRQSPPIIVDALTTFPEKPREEKSFSTISFKRKKYSK